MDLLRSPEALEAPDASGQEALVRDVEDLAHRSNWSGDETMVVPIDYLEVVATKHRPVTRS